MAAFLTDGGALAAGLGLGAASMLSIGPNNLMLLREGLARGRIVTVATTVWASYLSMLLSALAFVDAPRWIGPSTRPWLSWLGLASLCWFAVGAWRAALSTRALGAGGRVEGRRACVRRVLAVVWCNPLTYLELFVVPAAYCATLGSLHQRVEFIGAVMILKTVSCYGYALGGGVFLRLAGGRGVTRVFDVMSGLLLTGSAAALALVLTTNPSSSFVTAHRDPGSSSSEMHGAR